MTDDPDPWPSQGAPEAARMAVDLTTARYYGDKESHDAILYPCSRQDLAKLAAMLAAYLSACLKGAVTETGEQVDPAAALQGLGLVFGDIEGDHPT